MVWILNLNQNMTIIREMLSFLLEYGPNNRIQQTQKAGDFCNKLKCFGQLFVLLILSVECKKIG